MVRRDAVLFYCLTVLRRRVALVGEPIILWKLLCKVVHEIITIGLSENARGSDGKVFAVALDDGGVRQGLTVIEQGQAIVAVDGAMVNRGIIGVETVAIYYQRLWRYLQLVYGSVHGEVGGMKDVYLVYLLRRTRAHRPRYGIALYLLSQLVALFLRQLFGVIEHLVVVVGWQNDGSGIHRTSKAAPARLVAASFYLSCVIVR